MTWPDFWLCTRPVRLTSPPKTKDPTVSATATTVIFWNTVLRNPWAPPTAFTPRKFYANAKRHNQHRPAVRGLVDWPRVDLMKNRTNHFFDVKLTFSHHEDWWALLKQNKTQEAATWLRKSMPTPTYDYFERAHRFEFALYFGSQFEALPKDDPQHHPDLDPWLTLEGQAAFEELRQAERVVDAAWLQLASAVLRGHEPSVVSTRGAGVSAFADDPVGSQEYGGTGVGADVGAKVVP